jgi:general secretion pathway protein I
MMTGRTTGFTLLEVMVALAIIAISLMAVMGSQSQSLSLAGEAKFNTTAALLAQEKMAEVERNKKDYPSDDSGDFGEDFPGYLWRVEVKDVALDDPVDVSGYLKQVDLIITTSADSRYEYRVRWHGLYPKAP